VATLDLDPRIDAPALAVVSVREKPND